MPANRAPDSSMLLLGRENPCEHLLNVHVTAKQKISKILRSDDRVQLSRNFCERCSERMKTTRKEIQQGVVSQTRFRAIIRVPLPCRGIQGTRRPTSRRVSSVTRALFKYCRLARFFSQTRIPRVAAPLRFPNRYSLLTSVIVDVFYARGILGTRALRGES